MPKDSNEIRGFIAVVLPRAVKAFLEKVSADLKKCQADVKWVRPEAMHLTIKFLGAVPGALIPAIEKELRPLLGSQASMSMQVTGLGAFPGLNRPRVIWAGLRDTSGRLAPLAEELERKLEPLGFEREKRSFNPHLTLGRVRSNTGLRDLVEVVRDRMDEAGPTFVADRIVLFESLLRPSGAEYLALSSFDLSTGRSAAD